MLPKLSPLPCPARFEGGFPPLAAGCGMGEGECVGEVMRGLPGVRDGVAAWWGTLLAIAGEPWEALMEPKLMFGLDVWPTGPPLGMWPVVPEALIMTEGFLPCSPFCILPFTGDSLPCCTGALAPASDGPEAGLFAAWEKVLVALA